MSGRAYYDLFTRRYVAGDMPYDVYRTLIHIIAWGRHPR
jgi:hypothetical protein